MVDDGTLHQSIEQFDSNIRLGKENGAKRDKVGKRKKLSRVTWVILRSLDLEINF